MDMHPLIRDIKTVIHTIQEVIDDDEGPDDRVKMKLSAIVEVLETTTYSTASDEEQLFRRLVSFVVDDGKTPFNPDNVTDNLVELASNIRSFRYRVGSRVPSIISSLVDPEPEIEPTPGLSTPLNLGNVYPKPPRDVRCWYQSFITHSL